MPLENTQETNTPIVHIEVELSGSATMTFKGEFEGAKTLAFKHPRDAEAHARHMGYETITRKENPEYFAVIPWYSPYAEDDQSTQGSNW